MSSVASTANIRDMKLDAVSLFSRHANNVRHLLALIFELSDQCSAFLSSGRRFCEPEVLCDSVFALRGFCQVSASDLKELTL